MENIYLQELDSAMGMLSPGAKQVINRVQQITGAPFPAPQPEVAPAMPEPQPMRPAAQKFPMMAGTASADVEGAASSNPATSAAPISPMAAPVKPMAPMGAPPMGETANMRELNRLQQSTSGINQIKNPWARVPLQIADAVGSGLFPRIAMNVPGTQAHHDLLTEQARAGVETELDIEKQDAERRRIAAEAAETEAMAPFRAAQTEESLARAESLRNPKPATQTPHTVTTDKGIMQYNPATGKFDISVGQAPAKETAVTPQRTLVQGEDGSYFVVDELTGTATPVTVGAPSAPAAVSADQVAPEAPEVIESTDGPIEIPPTPTPPQPAPTALKGKKPAADASLSPFEAALAAWRLKNPGKEPLPEDIARLNISLSRAPVTQIINPAGEYNTRQLQAITRLNNDVSRNATYARAASMKAFATNVITALGRGDGTSDIAAINQFQKVIDEGAVTRDADVRLLQQANSLQGKLSLLVKRLEKGEQLTPQQRQQMKDLTNAMVADQQRIVVSDPYIKAKIAEAQQFGIDPEDTILGQIATPEENTGTPQGNTASGGLRVQKNSKGEFRYSTDGGKTWRNGKPPQ